MQIARPSNRELFKRIAEAKASLIEGKGVFANASKAVGELYALDIGDADEVWKLIRDLLDEISPENYEGSRPPERSYEKKITGIELFAFIPLIVNNFVFERVKAPLFDDRNWPCIH